MSEVQLVMMAQRGNAEAYGRLYSLYEKRLRALCAWLADPVESEDLAHDAFMKAFRALPRLREPDRFGPWLMQIARNGIRDRHADSYGKPTGIPWDELAESLLDDPNTSRSYDIARARGDLKTAIQKLPATLQQPLYLHYCLDLPAQQVAEVLGISINTAKWRIHEALAKCRVILRVRMDD